MAGLMEDVAHLTQEIGPRPAGTEEEQQAALFIADELQKEAGFSTVIEDFICAPNADILKIICYALALVCALVPLVLPVAAIPCLIIAILVVVLFVFDMRDKPLLERFFSNGVSQNVLAKYQPSIPGAAQRRRKIVLVANYDSGKAALENRGFLGQNLKIVRIALAVPLALAPLMLLIKTVFFLSDAGIASLIFNIIIVICMVLMAIQLALMIMMRVGPFTQGANNNASSVAVMVDVARSVGKGLVSNEELAARAQEDGVTVHGEEAAYAADVVPEGTELEYAVSREKQMSPSESLAAAKAAIEALTGKPVADKVPVTDISSKLVQHGNLEPDPLMEEQAAAVHFEVGEPVVVPEEQRTYTPRERMEAQEAKRQEEAARAEEAQLLAEQQAQQAALQQAVAAVQTDGQGAAVAPGVGVAAQGVAAQGVAAQGVAAQQAGSQAVSAAADAAYAQGVAQQDHSFERTTPEALQAGNTGVSTSVDRTPSWAKTAQAKARANKPDIAQSASTVGRSRFADTVAAQITAANTPPSPFAAPAPAAPGTPSAPAAAAQPEEPAASTTWSQATQAQAAVQPEPLSPLAARLASLRSEIESVEAPHFSQETKATIDHMAPEAQPAAVQPAAVQPQPTAQSAAAEQPVVTVQPVAQPAQPQGADQAAAQQQTAQQAAPVVQVQPTAAAAQQAVPAAQPATAEPAQEEVSGKTEAISPIDVSQYLDKEATSAATDAMQTRAAAEARVTTAEAVATNLPTAPVSKQEVQQAIAEAETHVDEAVEQSAPAAPAQAQARAQQPAQAAPAQPAQPEEAPVEPTRAMPRVAGTPGAAPGSAPAPDAAAQKQAPVAPPIVGLESMASSLPTIDPQQTQEEHSRHVIVLPEVSSQASLPEESKQRAPMADSAESTQSGSKALLSNMLPRIDSAEEAPTDHVDTFGLNVPSLDDRPQNATVSATGSFSTIGGTGSFAPVGDELVADVNPHDLYIDDADDSAYEEDFTETGAFAGPGYVDMPKSRAGRFFSKFRSKKKKNKHQDEVSVNEWIDTDDSYDARSVGKARGSWESFRDDDYDTYDDGYDSNDNFVDIDFDDGFDDDRGWRGGAFSLSRLTKRRQRVDADPEEGMDDQFDDAYGADQASDQPVISTYHDQESDQINRELTKINDFRHPDIDTEVWFVALGAELANHGGMHAFMKEHANELKGAIFINLESLGAGRLTYIEEEGQLLTKKPSSRLKRILRQAQERSGVSFAQGKILGRDTTATIAMKHGYQGVTLAGMEGPQSVGYASPTDEFEEVDEQILSENAKFVLSVLKSI